MIIAVIVVVVLTGVGVIARCQRRRRHEPDPEAGDVAPVSEVEQGTDVVLLVGAMVHVLSSNRSRTCPRTLETLPSNLAPRLLDETIRAVPHLQRVAGRPSMAMTCIARSRCLVGSGEPSAMLEPPDLPVRNRLAGPKASWKGPLDATKSGGRSLATEKCPLSGPAIDGGTVPAKLAPAYVHRNVRTSRGTRLQSSRWKSFALGRETNRARRARFGCSGGVAGVSDDPG